MCRKNKILAVALCAVLSIVALTGCGTGEEEKVLSELQKGRYVEKEVVLPQECVDSEIRQIMRIDGKLHMLLQGKGKDNGSLQVWRLEENDSFVDVTQGWLDELDFPEEFFGNLKFMQDKDGNQYLYACYVEEGEDVYKGHLWRSEGEKAVEITPEKWTVPDEQYGFYVYPNDITLVDTGTLVSYSYTGIDTIMAEDGSVTNSVAPDVFYGDWIAAVDDRIYQYVMDNMGAVTAVEVRTGEQEVLESIPFSQEQSGYVCFDVLEDGSIIAADTDGFFQCAKGDTNWKKVIDGTDTSFALTSVWCQEMVAMPDGSFYVLFGSDGGAKLMQYRYDPDAVVEIKETLTLYTVAESYLLQQAAVLYHKEHPEVLIEIKNGFSKMESYTAEPDYEQIYQELNTKLMAGEGPDILVLDGLNMDAYASKGLLVDMEELVSPLEKEGLLLSNITGNYRTERGNRYAVPLQFGVMFAIGRDIEETEMASMESLADTLAQKAESYMGPQTVSELVDKFYFFFTEEIVQDKQINREKLSERLEQLKKIADNCGMVEAHDKNERAHNIWDIAYRCRLAFYETDGFNQAMLPFSAAEFVNGSAMCFEQAFFPKLEIAINSRSEYIETAKDFIKFALSETVQSTDYYEGFPVNAASLEVLAGKDRTDAEAYTTIEIEEGMSAEFVIKSFSEEKAQKLVELCKSVSVRAVGDAQIRKVLIEVLPDYLAGAKSLEATLDEVEGGLKMYLAE